MTRTLCLPPVVFCSCLLAFMVSFPAVAQQDAAAMFKDKCANCHAVNGSGKTEAGAKMQIPDLRSAEVQKLTDDQLFESVALGKGHKNYPHTFSYKGLSDAQIHGLVRHVRELAHKTPNPSH